MNIVGYKIIIYFATQPFERKIRVNPCNCKKLLNTLKTFICPHYLWKDPQVYTYNIK